MLHQKLALYKKDRQKFFTWASGTLAFACVSPFIIKAITPTLVFDASATVILLVCWAAIGTLLYKFYLGQADRKDQKDQ